ncbi:hypothetical protein HWB03_gp59 [Salmonella phage ST-101]|uniref:Uncharacterized protein n=2 Tax=Chivirus ST101 TaxID=2846108 RepID=A0A5H2BIV1_9CAUD|nr:hypothetical protein HWB03_gp59 [Salmonella phage ST-101]ARB11984.1 hypothetical protein STCF101_0060 [Salmonella phage ST-101]ARB12089.1 hypothetical protein STCF374_0011 [Salmonella phage ST-374]
MGEGIHRRDILNDNDLLRVIYQKYGREIFTADFTRNI